MVGTFRIFHVVLLFPAFIFIVNTFTSYDLIKLFFGFDHIYTCIFFYTLFGLYSFVTGKRFMMFVNAATQVFKTMGLPGPDNIDLPKNQAQTRRPRCVRRDVLQLLNPIWTACRPLRPHHHGIYRLISKYAINRPLTRLGLSTP